MRRDSLLTRMAWVFSVACAGQPENLPPHVAKIDSKIETKMDYDDEGTLADVKSTITLAVVASDPDGDTLTFEWSATSGELTHSADSAVWTGAKIGDTASVAVHDGRGGTDRHSWEYVKAQPYE